MTYKNDLKQEFITGATLTQSLFYDLIDKTAAEDTTSSSLSSKIDKSSFYAVNNQVIAQEFIEPSDASITNGLVKIRKNVIDITDSSQDQQSLTISSPDYFLTSEISQIDSDNYELKLKVPTLPTTDGTYKLQVTISSGTPTYSWVSA